MGISLRDERGQGITEYILLLVVAVMLILGGVYTLNSAFKGWANNYFGEYLACLLETGELPSISGTGGDKQICDKFFKPFTIADGRPYNGPLSGNGSGGSGSSGSGSGSTSSNRSGTGNSSGAREGSNSQSSAGGGRGGSYGGGGAGRGSGSFTAGKNFNGKGNGNGNGSGKNGGEQAYTGNDSTDDEAYAGRARHYERPKKDKLDTRFAFDDEREKQKRRPSAAVSSRAPSSEMTKEKRAELLARIRKAKTDINTDDSGFSFTDIIRWLIIAGIIIAILLFLGGQGLQISKSME